MKINTKIAIKDLAGNPIPTGKDDKTDFTLGMALSNILVDTTKGGKMKLFILAQKIYSDEEVEIDEADLAIIKSAVEETENYNNLVNGQILQILSGLKDTK